MEVLRLDLERPPESKGDFFNLFSLTLLARKLMDQQWQLELAERRGEGRFETEGRGESRTLSCLQAELSCRNTNCHNCQGGL